jgi:hypothetical protein
MTEAEWLACDDARRMVEFIRDRLTDRKARLFACVAAGMGSPGSPRNRRKLRSAIATAEASADGAGAPGEMERQGRLWAVALPDARQSAVETARDFSISHRQAELADALRCVVGNPFRRPAIPQAVRAWNDHTIPKLAQAVYDERAFDRLPILADALEEAGCTDAELLGHLRGPGPHFRGCWALDVVLGRQ